MECQDCGYVLYAFTVDCPRCARIKELALENDRASVATSRATVDDTPKETTWYYSYEGTRHGPVPETVVYSLATTKQLPITTVLWTQGFDSWVNITQTKFWELTKNNTYTAPHKIGHSLGGGQTCPNCHGYAAPSPFSCFVVVLVAVLFFPIGLLALLAKRTWHCQVCGARFKR